MRSKEISLCENCRCMTYTLLPSSRCGECNAYKEIPKEEIGNKIMGEEDGKNGV